MSKKRSAISFFAGCLMLVISATSTAGNGEFDAGNEYPGVGALIVPAFGFFPICSVVLIEESLALTAGHCTADLVEFWDPLNAEGGVWVSFQADPGFFTSCFPGDDLEVDCGWVQAVEAFVVDNLPTFENSPPWASDTDDIGALRLNTPQPLSNIAQHVSYEGEIDDLLDGIKRKDIKLTIVGYGATPRFPPKHGPSFAFQDIRLIGYPRFLNTYENYLLTQQNSAAGNTGACFGDSGGPLFLEKDDEEILIALVNGGPNFCISTGVYYRLDTSGGQDFIDFVTGD